MNVAPNNVSGRVVNTVMSPAATREVHVGARRAADPVALHRLDRVGPVEQFEVVDETLGVGGDAHHPLAHVALEHGEVAAVGAPVGGDLFVGDHGAETRAPVDRCVAHVREPVVVDDAAALDVGEVGPRTTVGCGPPPGLEIGDQFADRACPVEIGIEPGVEDLGEDPLRPAVVVRIGGGDAAARVVRETEPTELAAVVGDVLVGGDGGVLAGLDRELLGRQSERVEAHRVEHVVPGHALEAGVHVGADEPERVADVEPGTRRIREHVEHEQLLAPLGCQLGVAEQPGRVGRLERAVLGPPVLPAELDVLRQGGRVPEAGGVGGVCARVHTGSPAYGSASTQAERLSLDQHAAAESARQVARPTPVMSAARPTLPIGGQCLARRSRMSSGMKLTSSVWSASTNST